MTGCDRPSGTRSFGPMTLALNLPQRKLILVQRDQETRVAGLRAVGKVSVRLVRSPAIRAVTYPASSLFTRTI